MAEETKLTQEEELLKAASGGSAEVHNNDSDDGISPEKKLIEELQSKLSHAETAAKEALEQRDAERREKDLARNQVKTAAEKQIEASENALHNALTAAKSNFESAQREWDDAYDAGDKQRLRDAQIKLNDAQAHLRGAEYQNNQFAEWKKSGGAVVSSDGSRFTKKEQEWIDKNPRFNTDRKFRAAVYAAHEEAVSKGIEIDSNDYFDNIEDYLNDLGLKETKQVSAPIEEKKVDEPIKKTEKKSSSTAIPPGGSGVSSSQSSRTLTFTMTPEHREAAAVCYPDIHRTDPKKAEEMYAARQLEIKQKRARGEQV